jgi:peptide chain release factor 1
MSPDQFRKLSKLAAKLQPLVQLAEQLKIKQNELSELQTMVSSNDTEIVDLANEEIIKCEEDIATIQDAVVASLLPRDDTDESSAILEVRSGAGGSEAALFTAEMLQMYQRYANYRKWHFEILSCHTSDIGGVKVRGGHLCTHHLSFISCTHTCSTYCMYTSMVQ